MTVQERFADVFHYAFAAEGWVKNYFKVIGFKCDHTFVSDLCIADWLDDASDVKDTYNRIIKEWGTDYKTFTEIVMCINLLTWFNDRLIQEGVDDREKWIDLYYDLYINARDAFYDKYEDDEEACDWFFKCTD